ncbi:autotransporter adhesin [Haemophilus haemolyticus]|uniref:Putative adhesin YadA, collagen-binding domain-containing protein n=1 Tax=Haemophilus haemolyticus M19501 TaxID=1028803 RepID=F9GRA0_HAEHA|nr:autotransporter adhesin [Haemophilus haemolyticus]EGT74073.1 putative adhesin YadA, collagen-binding domain-containing protein [Haemophilus haemolyticus M19501]
MLNAPVFAADVNPLMGGYDPKISQTINAKDPAFGLDKWQEYQQQVTLSATKATERDTARAKMTALVGRGIYSGPEMDAARAEWTERFNEAKEAQDKVQAIKDKWKLILGTDEKVTTFIDNMAIVANGSADASAKQAAQAQIDALFPMPDYIGAVHNLGETNSKLHQIKSVAAGKEDTDAVNVAQLKQAETHYFSINADEKEKGEDSNYDNRGAIYKSKNGLQDSKNAMAIGVKAKATSESSIAIGTESLAGTECYDGNCGGSDVSSIAIGYGAKSLNNGTISIGDKAIAAQTGGISIGRSSFASEQAVAIGQNAQVKTSSSSSIAIGDHALVEGSSPESVALGYETKVTKDRALALGYQANANLSEGVALGSRSKTEIDKGQFGYHPAGKNIEAIRGAMTEIEYEQVLTDLKDEVDKLRDNEKSLKEKEDRLADPTVASADKTTLTSEINTLKEKITKNKENITERKNKIKDITPWQSTAAGVSVGNSELGITRQINNLAAGTKDTDAVNVAQLKEVVSKIGTGSSQIKYVSINSTETGEGSNFSNDGAKSVNSVAIGPKAYIDVKSIHSVAIGQNARVESSQNTSTTNHGENVLSGERSVAIGENALTTLSWATAVGADTQAKGWGSGAFGRGAQAFGFNSTALGNNAKANTSENSAGNYNAYAIAVGVESNANGTYAISVGGNSSSSGYGSVALGSLADSSADRSIGLGYSAKATLNDGVAIGSNSLTEKNEKIFGYSPIGLTNIEAVIGQENYKKYTNLYAEYDEEIQKANKANQDFLNVSQRIKELDEKIKAESDPSEKANLQTQRNQAAQEWLNAVNKRNDHRKNASEKKAEADKLVHIWQSTRAGVSVGNSELGITRQINNLAAGTKDTDAVNVAQLRALANAPISFYSKGSETALGNATSLPLNNLNINFTDGLKAEIKEVGDEKKKVLFVGLDKTSLQNDPAFKGEKGDAGLAGKDGKDGKNGQDGQSTEIVMDNQDSNLEIIHQTQGGKKQVKINLNKDIKNLNSVSSKEFKSGETVMNEKGVTIGSGDSQVLLTEKGLNNGGNRIVNVASGVNPMDAVNKAQLDQAERNIQRRIDKVGKKADAGTASAIAQGSIPQVSAPGKMGIGIGSGFYGNQSSISLGASRMTDNGKWIFKGSFSSNTQGKVGVGAGAMYQW